MATITAIDRVLDRIDNLERNVNQRFDQLQERLISCLTPINYYVDPTENRLQSFDKILDQIRSNIHFIESSVKSIFFVSYAIILFFLLQLFF